MILLYANFKENTIDFSIIFIKKQVLHKKSVIPVEKYFYFLIGRLYRFFRTE